MAAQNITFETAAAELKVTRDVLRDLCARHGIHTFMHDYGAGVGRKWSLRQSDLDRLKSIRRVDDHRIKGGVATTRPEKKKKDPGTA